MNPLFKRASRAVQEAVRREFRQSGLGQLVQEVERATMKRGKAADYLGEIAKKLHDLGGSSKLRQSAERFKRGPVGREIARYGKAEFGGQVFDKVFAAFGPLGDILKSLLRPKGKALVSSIQRELQAAQGLLKAFGFETIPPPGQRQGVGGKAAAAQAFLESLGFKMTAPGTPPKGYPIKGRRAVPVTPEPVARTPRVRKTIDVTFGGRKRRLKVSDPLLTGEMIPVTSSNVHSIGFTIDPEVPEIGTLKVRFLQEHKRGEKTKVGGAQYEYYNVATELFEKFRRASSKGKFVWDTLRIRGTVSGHRYDYRLTGITNGRVPRKATLIGREEWFVKRSFKGERNGQVKVFHSGGNMRVRHVSR